MGLTVIAESVETAEQAEQLSEMGCAWAQGYHFSSPLPATAAGAFLRASYEQQPREESEEPATARPRLTLVLSEPERVAAS